MKTKLIALALLFSTVAKSQQPVSPPDNLASTNTPGPTPETTAHDYSIVERGEHHRVWQRTFWQTDVAGTAVLVTNAYTELEIGLYRKSAAGEWLECSPEISIQNDGGAVATNISHALYFPGSLYTDALECRTSDGKTLTSRPIGLSLFDGERSVLIAELRNGAIGQLLPSGDAAIYTNICSDVQCDLLVTAKKSGYEADMILRERIDPRDWGFSDTSRVRVQWLTEFFNLPMPATTQRILADGLEEEFLDFGELKMPSGKGFSLGEPRAATVSVRKHLEVLDGGRTVLVEEVPWPLLATKIQVLPLRTAAVHRDQPGDSHLIAERCLPAARPARHGTNQVVVAATDYHDTPGFLFDYTLTGMLTNYTISGGNDGTWYVASTVQFYGTTVLEGGAVIKLTRACCKSPLGFNGELGG